MFSVMGGNESCPAVVNVSNILPFGRTSFHKPTRKGETGNLWNNIQDFLSQSRVILSGMSVRVKQQSGVSSQLCSGRIFCFTEKINKKINNSSII